MKKWERKTKAQQEGQKWMPCMMNFLWTMLQIPQITIILSLAMRVHLSMTDSLVGTISIFMSRIQHEDQWIFVALLPHRRENEKIQHRYYRWRPYSAIAAAGLSSPPNQSGFDMKYINNKNNSLTLYNRDRILFDAICDCCCPAPIQLNATSNNRFWYKSINIYIKSNISMYTLTSGGYVGGFIAYI